jgi:HPt (histidine-containing phosphotransfer) domain-containing protein
MKLGESDASRLQALFQAYATELPARIEQIEKLWERAVVDCDAEAVEALRQSVHSLAGSGGTFGYAELSMRARQLELALEEKLGGGALLPVNAVDSLAVLFEQFKQAAGKPDAPPSQFSASAQP